MNVRPAPRPVPFPFIIPLLSVLLLAACGPVVAIPPAASEDAPMAEKDGAVYVLQAGDAIKLTVYGEEVLTGQYTVDQQGFITVPLIKKVPAGGLAREALQDSVSAKLVEGGYLTKPMVTVDITTTRPFYILGEVKNPGSYPWRPSMDVFKAIAIAGGYTPRAAKNLVLIDRGDNQSRRHMNASEATPVLPGDSITVRERIF